MRTHLAPAIAGLTCMLLLTGGLGLPLAPLIEEAPVDFTTAAPSWAPASSATIHPGVQMVTGGQQCTANFVFYDASNIYIGYAAHCAGNDGGTSPTGCSASSFPINTAVQIDGASKPGRLAYSSWIAMQDAGESNGNLCNYNDFALVRIDPADHNKVNPSVPFFGGPTALGDTAGTGSSVYSYQNSGLRFGISLLSPKEGLSLGEGAGGWTHTTYTITPGIPGDSGSGLLNSEGAAIGALSTVALAPLTGSNNFADLDGGLAYAASHGGPSVTLAKGTEPFVGGLLL